MSPKIVQKVPVWDRLWNSTFWYSWHRTAETEDSDIWLANLIKARQTHVSVPVLEKLRARCSVKPPPCQRLFDSVVVFVPRFVQFVSVLLLGLLLPILTSAQCDDPLCKNLRKIQDAAVIDFREYRQNNEKGPDVSIEGTKVPCQTSAWLNNVAMYICYAEVPAANSAQWYARTLQALQSLNPTWNFQIRSQGEDHNVDAGPADCAIPPSDGPYLGQCPLHMQTVKQNGGTVKLYLWINSFTSPYLLQPPPGSHSRALPTPGNGCDDFCENLKKAFEARANAFEDIRVAKTDGASGTTVKLGGAKDCTVDRIPGSHSEQQGLQFVCYWRESSGAAADTRFHDLISRVKILIPSNWSTQQENEVDDPAGEELTVWYGVEPGGKHEVRVYLSGESVGLHITASE